MISYRFKLVGCCFAVLLERRAYIWVLIFMRYVITCMSYTLSHRVTPLIRVCTDLNCISYRASAKRKVRTLVQAFVVTEKIDVVFK